MKNYICPNCKSDVVVVNGQPGDTKCACGTELTRCEYCNKVVALNESITKRIYRNRQWVYLKFCTEEHGSFYQMGCEG